MFKVTLSNKSGEQAVVSARTAKKFAESVAEAASHGFTAVEGMPKLGVPGPDEYEKADALIKERGQWFRSWCGYAIRTGRLSAATVNVALGTARPSEVEKAGGQEAAVAAVRQALAEELADRNVRFTIAEAVKRASVSRVISNLAGALDDPAKLARTVIYAQAVQANSGNDRWQVKPAVLEGMLAALTK